MIPSYCVQHTRAADDKDAGNRPKITVKLKLIYLFPLSFVFSLCLFVCAEISDYQQGDFNVVLLQWHGTAREQGTYCYVQVANNWVRTGKEDVNENVWKNANESRSICLERVPELRLKDHISCNNDPKLPFLWPFESSTSTRALETK